MQTHFFKLAKRKNYDIKVNTKRKNTTHQTYWHPFVPPPQKKKTKPHKKPKLDLKEKHKQKLLWKKGE